MLPVAVIKPSVDKFPVADIEPPVSKLPDVVLPVTVSDVNVPTEVMLGCAAVVTVSAVVAVPAEVAKVALATVPDTLAPGIDVSPAAEPEKVVADTLPDTNNVDPSNVRAELAAAWPLLLKITCVFAPGTERFPVILPITLPIK